MATTGQKWAIGCGIGCLLVVIALGAVGTCGYFGFREIKERADEMEAVSGELAARFGPPASWQPDPGPALPTTDVWTFVAVRETLQVAGADLARQIRTLDGTGPAGAVAKVRAVMSFVPAVVGYLARRDAVLLEADLHPGAYLYLYSSSYFVLLGHDPGAGPDFDVSGGEDGPGAVVKWEFGDEPQDAGSGGESPAERQRRVRRELNRELRQVLENQLAAVQAAGRGDGGWASELAAEIARLNQDRWRIPWQDGLPAELAASLETYRAELEATWVPELNVLEVARDDH